MSPPKLWWSESAHTFYFLDADAMLFRQACEPGHELFTGLRPLPDDAVLLIESANSGWTHYRCPECDVNLEARDDLPEVVCACGATIRARMKEKQ